MPLAPPHDAQVFSTLEELILSVNTHAGSEGYAVVTARSKKSDLGIKRKVWLRCDRGGSNRIPRGRDRPHTNTRIIDCQFKVTAVRNRVDGTWLLEVINPFHNHEATIAGSHPTLRKMAMTEEIKNDISRQLTVQTAPSKILSTLRIDTDNNNPLFKPRDIYNIKAQLRRDTLGPLTPVQALMQELDQNDWTYNYQKDIRNQITHLFFVRGTSQTLLKVNHEVLVMDCTYKTNRYKLPLLIISGQTALHTNFYVAFCFMAKEKQVDYEWTLGQLKSLYAQLQLPDPVVVVTDMERGLMNAVRLIFPNTNHLLCLWHINKNVTANCKKDFNTKEEWDDFISAWTSVVYAASRVDYESAWQGMNDTYYLTHEKCLDYLRETYIMSFHRRFVKFQVLHFGTTTTSRGEGGHAALKRHLRVSTGNEYNPKKHSILTEL